jgi:tape measure domain-containing protein
MADIATLGLEIQTGGVTRARRELDGLTAAGTRTEGMATRLSAGFGAFARFAGPIGIVGAAVALGGRQALITADAYTSLAGRLALVTGGGERLLRVQAALFEQAQRTRSDVAATTDLYGSLARSTQALGISQDRLLRVTESINQALIVSGTSGASAQAALVQLGQGFASGVLRGEELNSILEQTPRLAQAIADGLGVPLGQLRKLGQEGKLTAEAVFGALERAGAGLAAEFGRMPVTIAQAQTQVSNSIGKLVSTVDRLTGTTPAIARWISGFSTGLDGLTARIERSGGIFAALSDGLQQGALETNLRDLEKISARVAKARERLAERPDDISELQVLQDFNALLDQTVSLYLKLNGARGSTAPELSQDAAEMAKLLRQQRAQGTPDPDKPKRDPFRDEIASRRERISLLGLESEAERTAVQISVGAYGQLTAAQRQQLIAMAAAEDARRGQIDSLQGEAEARRRISELTERLSEQNRSETEALIAGNASLREEIEVLGAAEIAKAAIEQARIRSQRTLLEEAAAQRLNSGETEADIGFLRQQIELLRQREALIGQRAARREEVDARDAAQRLSDDTARDLRRDMAGALSAAFRDTQGDPLRAFGDALQNVIFTRVASALADSMATDLINTIGGSFASFFGGSNFVGPPAIAAGRAFGGTVSRGSLVPVNERGTEVLSIGSRDFLMAGANGYVTPAGRGGSGGKSVQITNSPQIVVQGGSDPAATRREVSVALAENNRQLMQMLHEQGVL